MSALKNSRRRNAWLAALALLAMILVAQAAVSPGTYAHLRRALFPPPPHKPQPVTLETVQRFASSGSPAAAADLRHAWKPDYAPILVEHLAVRGNARSYPPVLAMLRDQLGVDHGLDMNAWFEEVWQRPAPTDPLYAEFKASLYGRIDERMVRHFRAPLAATIRLDEIRWGGVRRDEIPPLVAPAMLRAEEAAYLADTDVVFGISVNGDARAYPKRILAWHELFRDRVGGREVAGVYCTLCGAMILFDATHDGATHELGTSGLLYRSNKLMYDSATESLWSALDGEPVVGPLVGKGIVLDVLPVVTTTWGEWRGSQPHTTVLSLETGHVRDYSEGAAYRDYFATDALMFPVPGNDTRLANKAEVFVVRSGKAGDPPRAYAAELLARERVRHDANADGDFVIVTDASGANRGYASGDVVLRAEESGALVGEDGSRWTVTEDALVSEAGARLPRLPAHRAFWFGWHAQFPETVLVAE